MLNNMSDIDRVVRFVVGVIIGVLSFYYLQTQLIGWFGYLIAFILVLTSITGFCPLYNILGISTN